MNKTVTFVIGATATGKTTFIKDHFSNLNDTEMLNVYDYQQAVYAEAGYSKHIPLGEEFKCLYKANENLLAVIIQCLQEGKNVVVEQTLYKSKRRIAYIDAIRDAIKNVTIQVYVMSPSDSVWESFIKERKLESICGWLKNVAKGIEFPNPSEGFNKIYEVVDGEVRLRMDNCKPEIVDEARIKLCEEKRKLKQQDKEEKERLALLESMNFRPFWHYCEVCGEKVFCTAEEAFEAGWDYPPQMGTFGLLGPRTCGKCNLNDTLFWKVQQQNLPIVFENELTEQERKPWQCIKKEPESLIEEEKE